MGIWDITDIRECKLISTRENKVRSISARGEEFKE